MTCVLFLQLSTLFLHSIHWCFNSAKLLGVPFVSCLFCVQVLLVPVGVCLPLVWESFLVWFCWRSGLWHWCGILLHPHLQFKNLIFLMVSQSFRLFLSYAFWSCHVLCLCGIIPLLCLHVHTLYLLLDPLYFRAFLCSFKDGYCVLFLIIIIPSSFQLEFYSRWLSCY